jgi:hypothetical protein
MGLGAPEGLNFGRSHVDIVNNNKVRAVYDYAYGEYLATNTFFRELSRVQSQLINNPEGEVDIGTGTKVSMETVGGALALNIFMETLDTKKEAMSGLAKLGLKNENKLWTLLG